MGILTPYKGATTKESLASENIPERAPGRRRSKASKADEQAVAGRRPLRGVGLHELSIPTWATAAPTSAHPI